MDSKLIKEIVYLVVDCIAAAEDENQINRLDKILDKLNMLVGGLHES